MKDLIIIPFIIFTSAILTFVLVLVTLLEKLFICNHLEYQNKELFYFEIDIKNGWRVAETLKCLKCFRVWIRTYITCNNLINYV